MYLFERYVGIQPFVESIDDFPYYERLGLRQLNDQCRGQQDSRDRYDGKPEYFQSLFDNCCYLMVQLAKLIKNIG